MFCNIQHALLIEMLTYHLVQKPLILRTIENILTTTSSEVNSEMLSETSHKCLDKLKLKTKNKQLENKENAYSIDSFTDFRNRTV